MAVLRERGLVRAPLRLSVSAPVSSAGEPEVSRRVRRVKALSYKSEWNRVFNASFAFSAGGFLFYRKEVWH